MSDPRDAVLFDLDGTLTDPIVGIERSFRYAVASLGLEIPSDYDFGAHIGPPMQTVLERLVGADAGLQRRARDLYRERFSTIGLFENRVYDGVHEMLERAGRNRVLYVCTSKPTVYARRILEHFDLSEFFAEIFGSELDGRHSDKGELLSHIVQTIALDPKRATMIGVGAIGVSWGYGSVEELLGAGALTIVHHPGEITDGTFDLR